MIIALFLYIFAAFFADFLLKTSAESGESPKTAPFSLRERGKKTFAALDAPGGEKDRSFSRKASSPDGEKANFFVVLD